MKKKLYKIRLQRHFFETCNKWVKWSGLSVDIKILSPGGCLPLPRGYIHVLNHEKNYIKSDFKDIFSKLATNEWIDNKIFLLTSTLCPLGLSASAPGLFTCIKSCKLVANDHSDKRFLLTSKCFPWGCLPLTCGYIHLLNHEKMCIKSEVEEILFKLEKNDHSDEAFLLI